MIQKDVFGNVINENDDVEIDDNKYIGKKIFEFLSNQNQQKVMKRTKRGGKGNKSIIINKLIEIENISRKSASAWLFLYRESKGIYIDFLKIHAYKRIKYNYGLEKNEYALLKKTTGNYCPICNYKLKEIGIRNKNMTNCIDHNKNDKKLGIEHNHRGIICDGCNTGTKTTNIIELLRKRIIFIQIHELFVGRLDVKQFRKEILFLRKNGLLDKNWDTKPIFKFHICLNKILDERKNKNNKMDFYLIKQTTAYKNIE